MERMKLCPYFAKGNCKFSEKECRFSHSFLQSIPKSSSPVSYKKPKNTECFEPSYRPADLRFLVEYGQSKSQLDLQTQDILVIPDLFPREQKHPFSIYDQLLWEMDHCGVHPDLLWKSWHGDTHWIADDQTQFKKHCPTFQWVLDTLANYFQMDIKATRFNFFENSNEWKPFHHDAAAVKPEKAKVQNFTVGVSFGATREIAFEDAKTNAYRNTISIPLPDGTTYAFTRDVNIQWKHGVPAIRNTSTNIDTRGRISIIAWGYVEQKDV